MREVASLDVIDVASPCGVPWDAMAGTDAVRYCGQCKLNVYNVSEMDRDEALALVRQTEGRLCMRFYRRNDGTVITRDCPLGVSLVRRKLARAIAAIAALVVFLAGGMMFAKWPGRQAAANSPATKSGPIGKLVEWLDPPVAPPQVLWGDICVPPVLPATGSGGGAQSTDKVSDAGEAHSLRS